MEETEYRYLEPKEVAEELKISPSKLHRILRAGRMRHYRDGKTVRIRRDWLDQYVEKQTSGETLTR